MARQVWAKKDPQSAATCIFYADQRAIILEVVSKPHLRPNGCVADLR
jgi:hypothetical protein